MINSTANKKSLYHNLFLKQLFAVIRSPILSNVKTRFFWSAFFCYFDGICFFMLVYIFVVTLNHDTIHVRSASLDAFEVDSSWK